MIKEADEAIRGYYLKEDVGLGWISENLHLVTE